MVLGELGGGEWRSRPAGEARRCRRSLRISPKAKGGSAVGVESRELIIKTDNKERGYVSGAAGQVARIEGDSCGGGNCLNLTFCVLAKEDSPATREQGPNSDVEDALNMGWEKISPGEEGFCWVRG